MRIRFLPAAIVGAAISLPLGWTFYLRPRVQAWGARPNDAFRPLPGDDLVPEPEIEHTRAVSIAAPPSAVWPWILQLGQGRGGLYSYDRLENLVGCDIHSVDAIVPELQQLAVGDIVSLRRGDMPAFLVQAIEPERALVMLARDPASGGPAHADPGAPMSVDESWAIVLEPDGAGGADGASGAARADGAARDDGAPGAAEAGGTVGAGGSRLLVRSRRRTRGRALDRALWSIVEIVSLPMERRMLLGIRDRAERSVGAGDVPSAA